MFITKLKTIAAAVLVFAVLLAGGGWLAYAALQTEERSLANVAPPDLAPKAPQKSKPPDDAPAPVEAGPWGETVDGLACRLTMPPRFVIGQAISAVIEVKNTSDKKRFIIPQLYPYHIDILTLEVTGPNGKLTQGFKGERQYSEGLPREWEYEPIKPGEVKRFDVRDLRVYFGVATGNYTAQFRFRSPKLPQRFIDSWSYEKGKKIEKYKDVPAEMTANQWANEAWSTKVSFELAPLAKDDLVVHEWGVFTVFNDVKYANVDRKEEWGSLPSFFYRQFPKERLCWVPSGWDKPIVYFYAKKTPLNVRVKVSFPEGAPVVWWPAVADPVEDTFKDGPNPIRLQPFRSLTWDAWIGDIVPLPDPQLPPLKVDDFKLPADCWVQQARLPSASRLTVIGNIEGPPKVLIPGSKDRHETERFLYYDGLVSAPDYLRCEKIDAKSVTLRNLVKFDIARLFVIDRRAKETVGFAFVDGTKQSLKAGSSLKIEPRPIDPKDWPATGVKQVRQALLDAGLFEAEADALLKIWDKRLLQADGVTAFHILPAAEYDRMLPIEISLPEPAPRPVRVGIALHPHLEIEPSLVERIGALVRQLDSPQADKRLAADKELLELGPLAIATLKSELRRGVSPQMNQRIVAILDRVDASSWLNFPAPAKKAEK